MPQSRRRPATPKQPQDRRPSERALMLGVATVLKQLDEQRGLNEAQRLANRHEHTDVMVKLEDGTEKTYEAVAAELDTYERNLEEDVPPRRWKAAREQAGLTDDDEKEKKGD